MPNCAIEQTTWCVNVNTADTQMIGPRPNFDVFCATKKKLRLPDLYHGRKKILQSRSQDDKDFLRICNI